MASVFDELGPEIQKQKSLKAKNQAYHKTLAETKGKKGPKNKKKAHEARIGLKKNHAQAHPKDPSTGANMTEIEQQARGATQGKYNTAWKNLSGQIGGEEKALGNLPTYYDRRFADMTTMGANQAAAANAIQQKLIADQAAVEQQTQGFRDTVAAESANNPLMASSNQAAQDASTGRTASAAGQAANIAAIGSLSKQHIDASAQNTRKEQGERTQEFNDRIAKLKTDQGDLAKEIGSDFIAQKSNILSGIGDRQVKAAAVKASAADDAAKNEIANAKLNETTRHNKKTEQTAAKNAETAARKAAKAGGRGASKSQRKAQVTLQGNVDGGKSAYAYYAKAQITPTDAMIAKRSGNKVGSLPFRIAKDLALASTGHKISPATLKLMHDAGYWVKGTGWPH